MHRPLEIALTYDVEKNSPPLAKASGSLYSGMELMPEVLRIMKNHGAPGTWYTAHDTDDDNKIGRLFPQILDTMAQQGEIASHLHFRVKGVVRTDEAYQREGIGEATRFLRSLGHAVVSFRGGNLFFNPATLAIIRDLGYETDSSVLPGYKVTMPDGLVVDHTRRRSCDPYYPVEGDPWSSGGNGLLEIPMTAMPIVSLKTPLVSVLINRLMAISNVVLTDPDRAVRMIHDARVKFPGDKTILVLSAHPHDFLGITTPVEEKMRNFDRFLAQVRAMPATTFVTASDIRKGWVKPERAERVRGDRAPLKLNTSVLRQVRNQLRSILGTIPLS
jgi:hypothetical protein